VLCERPGRGLVAQIEGKILFVAITIVIEAGCLEAKSSLLQPVVLGYAFDQQDFGGCFGFVLGAEAVVKFLEVFADFIGQDDESASETVAKGIQANGSFAVGGFGSGTVLRIGLVSRDLCLG
jgi:hypothetical protein